MYVLERVVCYIEMRTTGQTGGAILNNEVNLSDILSRLRMQIPKSLVSGQGWNRLLACVDELPASIAFSMCGFELRMGEIETEADFSFNCSHALAAQYFIAKGMAKNATVTERWIGNILAGNTDQDSWVNWILLAYDIIGCLKSRRVPAVYLSPLLSGCSGKLTPADIESTLERASGWVAGEPTLRHTVTKAYDLLPSEAVTVFVAIAPDRLPRSFRLIVAGIKISEIATFLEQIKWKGSVSNVLRILSQTQDVMSRFMVSIDLSSNGVGPRLGFEMYPTQLEAFDHQTLLMTWLKTRRSDWTKAIGRLVDMELCLPEKAAGLLSWPRSRNLYEADKAFRLHMGINHVKLVIEGDQLQAKAYAGLCLSPLN